jgi:hypothetical protein
MGLRRRNFYLVKGSHHPLVGRRLRAKCAHPPGAPGPAHRLLVRPAFEPDSFAGAVIVRGFIIWPLTRKCMKIRYQAAWLWITIPGRAKSPA